MKENTMCAILGFITTNPNKKNVKKLHDLYNSLDIRGRDACGIAIYRPWEKPKKKFLVSKKAIPVNRWLTEIFPKYEKDIGKSPLVVGHIRAQTQGTPKNPHNNHPVIGNKYLLTHNGSVTTTSRLDSYGYKGEVDTEIIVSYLEKDGFDGLKQIHGSAGIAFVDFLANPPQLYLWSHDQTFYLGMKEGGSEYWWSSLDRPLTQVSDAYNLIFSALNIAKFPEDKLLTIKFGDGRLAFKNLGEYEGQKAVYTYDRGVRQSRSFQSGIRKEIYSLPVHLMEGTEPLAHFIYGWNPKSKKFVIDIDLCEKEKIKPYLNSREIENLDYNDDWPDELFAFDQHNWKVFNKAVGVQTVAMALTFINGKDD